MGYLLSGIAYLLPSTIERAQTAGLDQMPNCM